MTPDDGRLFWRWLTVASVTYAVCHHIGSIPDGIGTAPSQTRWVDWIDLVTPLLVLGPVALALRAGAAVPREWACFLVGAVVYTEGHGVHLAANSVGNVAPGVTAHLWDEPVGHHVWFAGVAVVVLALVPVLRRYDVPRGPLPWLLAAVVGMTWGTNAIGGGTVVMSLVLAAVALVVGLVRRSTGAVLLVPAAVTAAVVVTVGLA